MKIIFCQKRIKGVKELFKCIEKITKTCVRTVKILV